MFLSYKVFTAYYISQSLISPISLSTYKRAFLKKEQSVSSIFGQINDFTQYRSLQSKVGMVWIIAGALLVLAFPTITSAMTSYTNITSAFIMDSNGG